MWFNASPQMWHDLAVIRQLVALRHQSPTREWPLVVDQREREILVIREWPDGSLTAYLTAT